MSTFSEGELEKRPPCVLKSVQLYTPVRHLHVLSPPQWQTTNYWRTANYCFDIIFIAVLKSIVWSHFICCHSAACSTTPWAIRSSTNCWSSPCSRSTSLVSAPNLRLFEELGAIAGVLLRRGAGLGIPSGRKEPLDKHHADTIHLDAL